MAILAILASLFGCGKHDPYILDGPGMEYVDSEYRTEYANCLPFEDIQGSPYSAIVYLGKGEDWFPVIPKYRNLVSLIKDNVGIVFAGETAFCHLQEIS